MAKDKTVFVCGECGYESAKWMGKCPKCESWNTMVEETQIPVRQAQQHARASLLSEVQTPKEQRKETGMSELDRVLGGGLLPGMVVLLGGDPGIGKSTLLLQAAETLAANNRVLYVSGEESAAQIKLRADRLGGKHNMHILCETELDAALEQARQLKSDILIIDSIQTMYAEDVASAPGSVGQVRQATAYLTRYAKDTGTVVLIVGHVTKEGAIAGPRVLEHIVDTVLYFEGDRHAGLRLLRAVKNRFGSTNEVGVFEMTDAGMQQVADPSRLFLSGEVAPGCAVTCVLEGTRPLLCEVQSLLPDSVYGSAKRTSTGIDNGRLALIIAVLEKKAHLKLSDKDVYLNVVGNLRLDERGADLAVALCIVSALTDKPLPQNVAAIGELGLTGEVRTVSRMDVRVRECVRLGYTTILLPASARVKADGATLVPVKSVAEAMRYCLNGK